MSSDYDKKTGLVRAQWDKQSHYDRFALVYSWLDMIQTWPQWIATQPAGAAWTANDLLLDPSTATTADVAAAQARADAMNAPSTAGEIDNALSHSYANLLSAIESAWTCIAIVISFPIWHFYR
jgi:glycine/D-amino acid oxidase-like deaminating enzyme